MKGILYLEDGRIFQGRIFGDPKITIGEVCFNTSMSGYQEILTDASYAGQIVVMSYPIIGNYGTNQRDVESQKLSLSGLVVREICRNPCNHRMSMSLEDYLFQNQIPGIEDVDTRALVRHIREKGEMRAAIAPLPVSQDKLLSSIRRHPRLAGQDTASKESTHSVYCLGQKGRMNIVVYDFGVKRSILQLLSQEATVTVVPSDTNPDRVIKLHPDGIVLSNGPGDPAAVTYAIRNIRKIIGKKPILGICLGHQLLGLALGGNTYRLKFGHHGGNHPVIELETGRAIMTVQNHGFTVDTKTIKDCGAIISHINLNDQTLEGFTHPGLMIYAYQFHPEAAPGPVDAQGLIGAFIEICRREKTSGKS